MPAGVVRHDRDAAERLLDSGQPKKAVESFRALLADTPDDPVLRGRLAEAYRESGNVDRAFHHYDQAAKTLTALGQDKLAADFLERCDELVPGQPEILFRRAKALQRLGEGQDLEATCERLVEAARAQGDRRRTWALERLIERRPDDLELALGQARALLEAGRTDEAAEVYRRLAGKTGGAPLPKAVDDELRAAARSHPQLALPLAETALGAGDPRGALAQLLPLHEKDPDAVAPLRLIVRALEQLGPSDELQAARIELIKAETRGGPNPEIFPIIGRLLSDRPRDATAVEVSAHALMVLGRTNEGSKLWARLVELHHATGRGSERDRAILQLLRAAPDDAPALRVASKVLHATGRAAEAKALDARIQALGGPSEPEPVPSSAESRPASSSGVYGRGLSWGRRPSSTGSADPSDTLEDALVESEPRDTDDMDPTGSAEAAAEALGRAVANVGRGGAPRTGPLTAFERRYPSRPGHRPDPSGDGDVD